jgi:hypothetical protein
MHYVGMTGAFVKPQFHSQLSYARKNQFQTCLGEIFRKTLKTGGVYPQGPKIDWQNEFVNRTLA